MAGGVALNSAANGRIARETLFENVFIQPAAGDSGGALGAALYVHHVLLQKPRGFVMEHAFWGKEYPIDDTHSAIEEAGFRGEQLEREDDLVDRIVTDLVQGKVVALFQGRFEWGPRALGNRSNLADPRRPEMKPIVNARIKFREHFRPFAPAILEERVDEYFDHIEISGPSYPLRYMLMVHRVKGSKAESIPTVTHIDGTGRLQTIRQVWNPLLYRVIQLFGEATGVPIVLNTCFNLRGEPIVASPRDALRTFGESGLDRLYLDGHVIHRDR